ncbi:uncharacterized protein [Phaseolus vulgaris]|uniref:uncharacterized protein n=1 Tax=Phaseolus vulgaris TaxID=3885 RepID=UPI0035CB859A
MTDLDEHIDVYTTHMSLYTTDDVVMCRVFPTSLKGGAFDWFTKVSLFSIDSFTTMMSKFETQFTTSRPHHLTSIALVGIRQEKGESLRTFFDRFSKVAMSIQNLSPDVAMPHMLTALRPGPFADSLYMQPVDNLDELKNKARAEADGEKECQGQSINLGERRRDNQFSRYTPLTIERGKILDEALSAELIPTPRKASSPKNVDRRKRCRYHQNSGHSTEECQALKDKIDELIQAGHLQHFVHDAQGSRRSPRWDEPTKRRKCSPQRVRDDHQPERQQRRDDCPRRDDHPWENERRDQKEVINTIVGGFSGSGNSNSNRKKHLKVVQQVNAMSFRPRMLPITFIDDDFKGVDYRQDDPMVISVDIDKFTIMKTLVD